MADGVHHCAALTIAQAPEAPAQCPYQPALLKLSDSEITLLMALSRPLDPALQIQFMECMAVRLNGHAIAGEGLIHRLGA